MQLKRKAQGGFTLIELLIAMVVLAITLAFGVPAFQDSTANSALRSTTMELVTALNAGRAEAVSRRSTLELKPADGSDDNWESGWLLDYDPGEPDATQDADLQSFSVRGSVTIDETSGHDKPILFRSNGIMEVKGGGPATYSFLICDDRDDEEGRTITINRFGQVTNTRHAGPGTCNP